MMVDRVVTFILNRERNWVIPAIYEDGVWRPVGAFKTNVEVVEFDVVRVDDKFYVTVDCVENTGLEILKELDEL